jgi:CRISPR-associated protein Csh1
MIKTIAEFGKLYQNDEQYLTQPYKDQQDKKLICIVLKSADKINYSYESVEFVKDLDKDDFKSILFSKGSPNGPNKSPSAEVTESEKTVTKKIIAFFKDSTEEPMKNIFFLLNENKLDIITKVEEFKQKYEKLVLSVKINDQFLKDVEEIDFKQILLEKQVKKTGKMHPDTNCCICHSNKEILDKGSPFPFFTTDKPGYAYGLNSLNSYKMLPICQFCSDCLYNAKIKLNDLSYYFYGNKYLLIPKFFNTTKKEEIFSLIRKLEFKIDFKSKQFLQEQYEHIFRFISTQNNFVSFYILFYNAPKGLDGSELKIDKCIENVFPSQFKELYNQIDSTNDSLKGIMTYGNKKEEKQIKFSFWTLKTFFRDNELFIQIIYDIFNKNKLSYDMIMSTIAKEIRITNEKNVENNYFETLGGLLLLNFLSIRKMIKNTEGDNMIDLKSDYESNDIVRKLSTFFKDEKQSKFYNSYEKILAFSMGVLIGKLLWVQGQNLNNNAPFYSKLKNFKLRSRDLLNLYKDACDKLKQYDESHIERYHHLKAFIAELFSKTEEISKWSITNDELNFYLSLGLNLSSKFSSDKDKLDKEAE